MGDLEKGFFIFVCARKVFPVSYYLPKKERVGDLESGDRQSVPGLGRIP